jgi:hypothetical protein
MQEITKGAGRSCQIVSPPLKVSRTQEASSAERQPTRDPSARLLTPRQDDLLTAVQDLLFTELLPIVRFIARRIHERLPQHVLIGDLHSAGVLGLLDAFGRFDTSKRVLFRPYAQFRIRGAILDSLRTLDWSPRGLRRKGRAIERAQSGRLPASPILCYCGPLRQPDNGESSKST